MTTLISKPLDSLATAAGISAPVASFGADVTATMLLEPIVGPVEKSVHFLEVAGIVIGLATGLQSLVVICVKHLAHDEFGNALTGAFKQFINQITGSTDARTVDEHQSVSSLPSTTGSATASQEPAPCHLHEQPYRYSGSSRRNPMLSRET